MELNFDLIFVHSPPKKEPQLEKTDLMEVQADWNFPRNQPPIFPKTLVIDRHIPEKNDFAPFHTDFTPFNACLNLSENHDLTFAKIFVMPDQIPLKKADAEDHVFFAPLHASEKNFVIAFQAVEAADLIMFQTFIQNSRNPSTLFHRY